MKNSRNLAAALAAAGLALSAFVPAQAQSRYGRNVSNDISKCHRGAGPAILVTVDGIESSRGRMRAEVYNATASDWLSSGRWLTRTETAAKAGTMQFCLPVSAAGTYGVAVRHDANGNGKTDLSEDGGAMSNNPTINIFNLGKPSYRKVAFGAGPGVTSIRVKMRYM